MMTRFGLNLAKTWGSRFGLVRKLTVLEIGEQDLNRFDGHSAILLDAD